ncbi:MAG: hypothetical protein KA002_01500, partial [Firmicutes bacterium]|nr:hypothetical protein [Bacillota bacterium]
MKRLVVLVLAVVFTFSCCCLVKATGMDRSYLFSMDTAEEAAKFDNDNTGAKIELSREVVRQGSGSLKITPNRKSPETKIAVDIAGDTLSAWIGNDALAIHVFIPEKTKVAPNSFFLGMADLSDGWAWVGGVFATSEVKPGWNQMKYALPDEMSNLRPNGSYKIYLAWAHVDDAGRKLPLREKFFIDGIGLAAASLSREDLIRQIPEHVKAEVAGILDMDDEAILDVLERKTFDYLWCEANPSNGLIRDRTMK